MNGDLLRLQILLPSQVFAEAEGVTSVVAETRAGAFGILPHRLDGVAALAPGILIYETAADGEHYVAVDEGLMVKAGADVLVSVRRAMGGTDLGRLRDSAQQEFGAPAPAEERARAVMTKLETEFLQRLRSLHHE